VAGAAGLACRPTDQLWLRGRSAPPRRTRCPGVARRGRHADTEGARRLAGLQGSLHPRIGRAWPDAAGRRVGRGQPGLGHDHRGDAPCATTSTRRMAGKRRRPGYVDHAEACASDRRRRSGNAALLSFRRAADRGVGTTDTGARGQYLSADATGGQRSCRTAAAAQWCAHRQRHAGRSRHRRDARPAAGRPRRSRSEARSGDDDASRPPSVTGGSRPDALAGGAVGARRGFAAEPHALRLSSAVDQGARLCHAR